MQQIGVALSKRLADHTHYSSGLGGDTLSHLTQDRTKQGEWDGDEFINHSIYSEIILSQDWGPTIAETMDHRYEGFKVALTDDMNIAGIMVFLGQSAAITNNPLMIAQIWTDVAGSPGALVGTFDEIPVYPACTKYAGTPPSAWATFVYNGAGWFDPPFSGDYWIILDRSAGAPVGGNIQIGRTGTGTSAWVWSDNAIAWTTENNKGGVVMLLGYTQPAAFLTSWLNNGLMIVNQYGGYGISCLCYGGGDAVVGVSYEGRGGVFESVSNHAVNALSSKSYAGYFRSLGTYGVWIEAGTSNLGLYVNTGSIVLAGASGTISLPCDGRYLNFSFGGSNFIKASHASGSINILTGGSTNRLIVDSSGRVSISEVSPDASAQLDVVSTTRGFLPPRMTTVQRDAIAAPATGLVIYNTTTNVLNFYNGAAWGPV